MKKVLFVTSLLALMFPLIASAQTKSLYHEFISKSECDSFTWTDGNGETYDHDTVAFYISGDTLYVLDLEIRHGNNYTDDVAAGCKYTWGGQTYTESGTYNHTFQDRFGCDSVVTLTLTIEDTGRISYVVSSCKKYTWRNKTFTADTICTDTVSANPSAGTCAELHTLDLTIITPAEGTFTDTTVYGCGFASLGTGTNRLSSYTTRDTSRLTLITADGQCIENTLLVHFVINEAVYNPIVTSSCGPFVFHGKTYNESKIDTIKVGKTVNNCDSMVVMDLTVYDDLTVRIVGNLDLLPGQSTTLSSDCNQPDASLNWSYSGQTSSEPSITLTNLNQNTDVALTATSADQNCSRTTYVTVMVSPYVTGIDDVEAGNVNFYPNPASALVNIQSPKSIETVTVFNMAGQKIDEVRVASDQFALNVSNYNNGIYMICLRMADGSVVNQKVAVKK